MKRLGKNKKEKHVGFERVIYILFYPNYRADFTIFDVVKSDSRNSFHSSYL
jgi:hypothetical protein